MRVVFDTNVVLDVLLERKPWVDTAADLLAKVETGVLEGYLVATTITTIHYIAAKAVGALQARQEIRKLLKLFSIAPIHRPVLESALELDFSDFEDAVLYEASRQVAAEAIVSRDPSDFKKAELPVLSPKELVKLLEKRAADQASR